MVVTYYIKLFRTGADRHDSILMSLLLLVAESIKSTFYHFQKAFNEANNIIFFEDESPTLNFKTVTHVFQRSLL